MKLTNLHNDECSQVLQVRSYACLKTNPVVSNANCADNGFEELLPSGNYN